MKGKKTKDILKPCIDTRTDNILAINTKDALIIDNALTIREISYLEVYAKTFDHQGALKGSGLSDSNFKASKYKNNFFKDRIVRIQKAWIDKFELCPEVLSGKLMSTIDKLDKAIDIGEFAAASPLVKAIELGMKTTNMLEAQKQNTGTQIFFNIDLSHDKSVKKVKKVKLVNIL